MALIKKLAGGGSQPINPPQNNKETDSPILTDEQMNQFRQKLNDWGNQNFKGRTSKQMNYLNTGINDLFSAVKAGNKPIFDETSNTFSLPGFENALKPEESTSTNLFGEHSEQAIRSYIATQAKDLFKNQTQNKAKSFDFYLKDPKYSILNTEYGGDENEFVNSIRGKNTAERSVLASKYLAQSLADIKNADTTKITNYGSGLSKEKILDLQSNNKLDSLLNELNSGKLSADDIIKKSEPFGLGTTIRSIIYGDTEPAASNVSQTLGKEDYTTNKELAAIARNEGYKLWNNNGVFRLTDTNNNPLTNLKGFIAPNYQFKDLAGLTGSYLTTDANGVPTLNIRNAEGIYSLGNDEQHLDKNLIHPFEVQHYWASKQYNPVFGNMSTNYFDVSPNIALQRPTDKVLGISITGKINWDGTPQADHYIYIRDNRVIGSGKLSGDGLHIDWNTSGLYGNTKWQTTDDELRKHSSAILKSPAVVNPYKGSPLQMTGISNLEDFILAARQNPERFGFAKDSKGTYIQLNNGLHTFNFYAGKGESDNNLHQDVIRFLDYVDNKARTKEPLEGNEEIGLRTILARHPDLISHIKHIDLNKLSDISKLRGVTPTILNPVDVKNPVNNIDFKPIGRSSILKEGGTIKMQFGGTVLNQQQSITTDVGTLVNKESVKPENSEKLDAWQIGSIIATGVGAVASFVPVIGSGIALACGVIGTGLDAVHDVSKHGFDRETMQNLGLNLGLTALSVVPGLGAARLVKNSAKGLDIVGKIGEESKVITTITDPDVIRAIGKVTKTSVEGTKEGKAIMTVQQLADKAGIQVEKLGVDSKKASAILTATPETIDKITSALHTVDPTLLQRITNNAVTRAIPKIMTVGAAVNGIRGAYNMASKIGDPNQSFTEDDWKSVEGGIFALSGLTRGLLLPKALKYVTGSESKVSAIGSDGQVVHFTPEESSTIAGINGEKNQFAKAQDLYKNRISKEISDIQSKYTEGATMSDDHKSQIEALKNKLNITLKPNSMLNHVPFVKNNFVVQTANTKGSLSEPDPFAGSIEKGIQKWAIANKTPDILFGKPKTISAFEPSIESPKVSTTTKANSEILNKEQPLDLVDKQVQELEKILYDESGQTRMNFKSGGIIKAKKGSSILNIPLIPDKSFDWGYNVYDPSTMKKLAPVMQAYNKIRNTPDNYSGNEKNVLNFQRAYAKSGLFNNWINQVGAQRGYDQTALGTYLKNGSAYNFDAKKYGITDSWINGLNALYSKINAPIVAKDLSVKPGVDTTKMNIPGITQNNITNGAYKQVNAIPGKQNRVDLPDLTNLAILLNSNKATERMRQMSLSHLNPVLLQAPSEIATPVVRDLTTENNYQKAGLNIQHLLGRQAAGTADINQQTAILLEGQNKANESMLQGNQASSQVYNTTLGNAMNNAATNAQARTNVANQNAQNMYAYNMGVAGINNNATSIKAGNLNNFLLRTDEDIRQNALMNDQYNKSLSLQNLQMKYYNDTQNGTNKSSMLNKQYQDYVLNKEKSQGYQDWLNKYKGLAGYKDNNPTFESSTEGKAWTAESEKMQNAILNASNAEYSDYLNKQMSINKPVKQGFFPISWKSGATLMASGGSFTGADRIKIEHMKENAHKQDKNQEAYLKTIKAATDNNTKIALSISKDTMQFLMKMFR